MSTVNDANLVEIGRHFVRLPGDSELPPDVSIVIPVNAQADLQRVLRILTDIARYAGKHTLETILVINNYPPDAPPPEIGTYGDLGLKVVSTPSFPPAGAHTALAPRSHPIVSARDLGVRAAASGKTIHFDADCHVPNVSALVDWYVEQLGAGTQLAYTHVGFYEVPGGLSARGYILIHHLARWVKRVILRIPNLDKPEPNRVEFAD